MEEYFDTCLMDIYRYWVRAY